jgi:hypothetical protein
MLIVQNLTQRAVDYATSRELGCVLTEAPIDAAYVEINAMSGCLEQDIRRGLQLRECLKRKSGRVRPLRSDC